MSHPVRGLTPQEMVLSQFKGNRAVLRTCNDSARNNTTAAKTTWLTLCNILQMLHSPLDPR